MGTEFGSQSSTAYSDFTNFVSVNAPQEEVFRTDCSTLRSRNHWQPLLERIGAPAQSFLMCHWSSVKPFALSHAAEFRPNGPPLMNSHRHQEYLSEIAGILNQSATLNGARLRRPCYHSSLTSFRCISRSV